MTIKAKRRKIPIRDAMVQGFLPNPYEIQSSDKGRYIDADFGNVLPSDIGKAVKLVGDVLYMETVEQAENRRRTGYSRGRILMKAVVETEGFQVYLSGIQRAVIWDCLYGARASGRYSGQPERQKAIEQVMDKMRIIDNPNLPPGKRR
jgi:hypothetical protein